MGGPGAWIGGLVVSALLFGAPAVRAELAEVRGLRLQAPGLLHSGTRDELLAQAAQQAVSAAWQSRHPDRRLPFLSERLATGAVRYIDVIEESIAPDRYAVVLDVGVAMGVLRAAAGLPADMAPVVTAEMGPESPPVRILVPASKTDARQPHREPTEPSGARWIHLGSDAADEPRPVRLRIGTFVGSGRAHPSIHCLSAEICGVDRYRRRRMEAIIRRRSGKIWRAAGSSPPRRPFATSMAPPKSVRCPT